MGDDLIAQNTTFVRGTKLASIEDRFAQFPRLVPNFLYAIGGLLPTVGTVLDSRRGEGSVRWLLISLVGGVLIVLLATWISKLQEALAENEKASIHEVKRQADKKYLEAFTQSVEDFVAATWETAEIFATSGKTKTDERCMATLRLILQLVSRGLGTEGGVRACIFLVNEDKKGLRAWKDTGRKGSPTIRQFYPLAEDGKKNKTYDHALRRIDRFEPDTSTLGAYDRGDKWPYGTFAAWPIATSDRLYGILTVDAKNAGDISEYDLEKLRMFAAIGASALSMHSTRPWIPIGRNDDLLPNFDN